MTAYFDRGEFKRLRLEYGMTQKDVAEGAGMSQSAVCLVETGKKDPSPRMAIDLACALGLTVYGVGGVDIDDPDEEMDRWDALEGLLAIARMKETAEAGDGETVL